MRPARPEDRPLLLDLWVAAWRRAVPEIDFDARRSWLADMLDGLERAGGTVLVAEDGGSPAGFVTIDRSARVVDQLAVDPARQGRGVAMALLDAAKAACPGGFELVVNRDNAAARRLYARHGFAFVAEATNPNSGRPTLVLRWSPGAAPAPAPGQG